MQCWAHTPGNHIREQPVQSHCSWPLQMAFPHLNKKLYTAWVGFSFPVLHSWSTPTSMSYLTQVCTSLFMWAGISSQLTKSWHLLTHGNTPEASQNIGHTKGRVHALGRWYLMDSDCKISAWTTWPHAKLWLQGLGFLNYTKKSNSDGSSFGAPHSNAIKGNELVPLAPKACPC